MCASLRATGAPVILGLPPVHGKMPPMEKSLVAEWDNFYVIVGSSAAALTGLTFVVIALSADSKRVNFTGFRAYVEPTIVHFCAVLALACYLSMPHQGRLALSLGLAVGGAAGLAYVTWVAATIGRFAGDYMPVREDWIWNAILPGVCYAVLLAAGVLIWYRPGPSLYAVGTASLALTFIGIHNAWDVAVWNAVRNRG
jgi:hypothetical protein